MPPLPKLEYRDSGAAATRLHEAMTDIPARLALGAVRKRRTGTDDDGDEDDGDA